MICFLLSSCLAERQLAAIQFIDTHLATETDDAREAADSCAGGIVELLGFQCSPVVDFALKGGGRHREVLVCVDMLDKKIVGQAFDPRVRLFRWMVVVKTAVGTGVLNAIFIGMQSTFREFAPGLKKTV